jgi:hypothetical protein
MARLISLPSVLVALIVAWWIVTVKAGYYYALPAIEKSLE